MSSLRERIERAEQIPRCQERHPEGGQCELRAGHDFEKHLAGMIMWAAAPSLHKDVQDDAYGLIAWVNERLENCKRIANIKTDQAIKEGWLEDAWYFEQIAAALHKEGAESRSVQRRVALQKGEKMPTFSGAAGDADCRAVLTKEGDRCALEAGHGGAHQLKIPGTKETKP